MRCGAVRCCAVCCVLGAVAVYHQLAFRGLGCGVANGRGDARTRSSVGESGGCVEAIAAVAVAGRQRVCGRAVGRGAGA